MSRIADSLSKRPDSPMGPDLRHPAMRRPAAGEAEAAGAAIADHPWP